MDVRRFLNRRITLAVERKYEKKLLKIKKRIYQKGCCCERDFCSICEKAPLGEKYMFRWINYRQKWVDDGNEKYLDLMLEYVSLEMSEFLP